MTAAWLIFDILLLALNFACVASRPEARWRMEYFNIFVAGMLFQLLLFKLYVLS